MSKIPNDLRQTSEGTGTGNYEFVLVTDPTVAAAPFIAEGAAAIRRKLTRYYPQASVLKPTVVDASRLERGVLALVVAFDKTTGDPAGFYTASAFEEGEIRALKIEDAYAVTGACGIVGEAIQDMELLAKAHGLQWVYLQTARKGWKVVAERHGYSATTHGRYRRFIWAAAAAEQKGQASKKSS